MPPSITRLYIRNSALPLLPLRQELSSKYAPLRLPLSAPCAILSGAKVLAKVRASTWNVIKHICLSRSRTKLSVRSANTDAEEALLLTIMKEMEVSQPKRPLQCVTYKMPLPHYLRMKNVASRWHLTYSDLLRLVMLRVTAALEEPNGELLEMLEQHRQAEIERRAARIEKRKRQVALIA